MEQGRAGQSRAEHQHSQAIQLFSMTILHDLRVTLCVCSEGSALFHIILALNSGPSLSTYEKNSNKT